MKRASFLVVVLSLLQSVALAQNVSPEEPEVEAGERFARGVELYKEGAYRAALVEFQRAYATAPDFRLLYNIGRTQLKLQDYLAASQSYERYLREGGAEVPPERRSQVEEDLTELRRRVGGIRLSANRAGLEVLLDDVEVGTTPLGAAILTNVGRHRLSLRAPDGGSAQRTVDIAGGDLVEVTMSVAEPSRVRVSAEELPSPWSQRRKLALAGWVTGGLLLAGSAVTGVLALRAENELDDLLRSRSFNQKDAADERDVVRTLAITSDVLLGVGAATVVSATVLWFVGGDEARPEAESARAARGLSVGVGLGSATLTGAF